MMFKASNLPSPWVSIAQSKKASAGRLLCFPFAGGGATAYHGWIGRLAGGIDLVRVKLPGREDRLDEAPFTHLPSLVEAIVEEFAPWIGNQPFALFGHSMGGLIAFEVARGLRRRKGLLPVHLFVSGCQAPHFPRLDRPCSHLPDAEFINRVRQYGGIPDFVTQNEELLEIFIPILKADFKMLETYFYQEEPPLEFPLTAFGGISDPKFGRKEINAWAIHTSSMFSAHFFPGGHFFLHESEDLIIDQVNLHLHDIIPAAMIR